MPFNQILWKCTAGYKLNRSQDQSPNIHGWHQTICKNEKKNGNSNTRLYNIESGHRNGI